MQVVQCRNCKFYLFELRCLAFPSGIPLEFLNGGAKHDRVVSGQDGDFVFTESDTAVEDREQGEQEAKQATEAAQQAQGASGAPQAPKPQATQQSRS